MIEGLDYFTNAFEYWTQGWNVIPVKANKRPLVNSWKQWINKRQTAEEVNSLNWGKAKGVAGITGVNGYCAMDIDKGYIEKAKNFVEGWEATRIHLTPNDGEHLVFKSKTAPPSIDKWKERFGFELQGIGNYIILPHSFEGKYKVKNQEVAIREVDDLYKMIQERASALGWRPDQVDYIPIELDKVPIWDFWQIPCVRLFRNRKFPEGARELTLAKNFALLLKKVYGNNDAKWKEVGSELVAKQENFPYSEILGWKDWAFKPNHEFNCREVKNYIGNVPEFKDFKCWGCPIHPYIKYGVLDLAKATQYYRNWLAIEDDFPIGVVYATFLSNFIKGDPVWLNLIGASGSTKTEYLRSFMQSNLVFTISTLTSHTLISGKKNTEDLMPQLDGKLLIIKDFTSILQSEKEEKKQLFAQLREAYDGYLEKGFGSGVGTKRYKAHFSILTACTPIIDQSTAVEQLLGERFLYLRLTDHSGAVAKAFSNIGRDTEMRGFLQSVNYCYTRQLLNKHKETLRNPDCIKAIDSIKDSLIQIAQATAMLRTQVARTYSDEIKVIPEAEVGTRLVKQLGKLALCLKLLQPKKEFNTIVKQIRRIASDTIPRRRIVVLDTLAKAEEDNEGFLSTSKLATQCNLPTYSTRMELEDLTTLGFVDRESSASEGGKLTDSWVLNELGKENLAKISGDKVKWF